MGLPPKVWLRRCEQDIADLEKIKRVKTKNIKKSSDAIEFDMLLHGAAIINKNGDINKEHLLRVTLSKEYPYQKPIVEWKSQIWHPNVAHGGAICIAILKKSWDNNTVTDIANSLIHFLTHPDTTDPYNSEAKTWYTENPDKILKARKEDKAIEDGLNPVRIKVSGSISR